ncbi:hypothetical protein [Rhizohabitans arisaemae]|uniref:hypothetical protein n=1 Tax=Rhizohabitans arisaemae TaxID=2720610 RepID=UPI0024B215A1|nr:hypothetical protein [Rhizohabitans arisaemae]
MRVKRWAASLSASALLAAGLVAGTAGAAHAVPTGCGPGLHPDGYYYSSCSGGTGEHRIVIIERHHLPGVGPIDRYGPWQPVGTLSTISPRYSGVTNAFVLTR